MRRREFITLLSAAAVWPVPAQAQRNLPVIGYLGASTQAAERQRVASFVQRLGALGWIEGRTIRIEYRRADARAERYGEIAAEFVAMKVDVIVALGAAAPAVRNHIGYSDRLHGRRRSGWQRPRRVAWATGRQCHWPVHAGA